MQRKPGGMKKINKNGEEETKKNDSMLAGSISTDKKAKD